MATMSYATFLRGRPSSRQLAVQWDKLHNGGAKFGQSVPGAPINPATGLPYTNTPYGTGYGPGIAAPGLAPVTTPGAVAAPAAPAAPAPEAVTLGPDPRIESYLMQGRGAVAGGNAGRLALGTNTAFGLTDSGLLERSRAEQAGSANAGFADAPDLNNITYRIIQGPEGRLYRQAYASIAASGAARGAGYGSGQTNAQEQARGQLNAQRNATMRGFDASQNQSLFDQSKGLGQIAQNIADVRAEQAATAAAVPVPEPVAVPTPASPTAPAAPGAAKKVMTAKKIPGFRGFSTNAPNWLIKRRAF